MVKKATSEKSKNGVKNAATPKFGFINYRLSRDDVSALEALDCDAEFPYGLIDEFVLEGYKFSSSYDEKNQTCIASLTDRVSGSAYENKCLSGRGATPADAWHALCYRHLVLAQSDWAFFGSSDDSETPRYG